VITKKILGNKNWIGNLLKDLQSSKHQFFLLVRGMSNLLKMLCMYNVRKDKTTWQNEHKLNNSS